MTPKSESGAFALCLDNRDYEGSLSIGKVYAVLPDAKAATLNYIRVVDDTGEDYVFNAKQFAFVELPRPFRKN